MGFSDECLPTMVLKAGTIVHVHGYPVRILAAVTIEASPSGIEQVNRELAKAQANAK